MYKLTYFLLYFYLILQNTKNLDTYKAQFDIVLVEDESMDLTNALLKKIL